MFALFGLVLELQCFNLHPLLLYLIPQKQGPVQSKMSRPIPVASDIKTFFYLYSTLLPQMIRAADKTEPGGSPRDFHSSEVLSELPPLRVAVAGQGYHYRRMRSSQCSSPLLLLDRWGPLCTFSSFIYDFLKIFRTPQVVFALLPHRFSLLGSSADVILPSDMTAFTVFVKVQGSENF